MKILVAEDSAVTATLMSGILTRHGYSVVLARNGAEALRLLESDPDIQGVITDIMMPEASGLDLLQAIRNHEKWKTLPTIVVTVRRGWDTVGEAAALGCKEYILKPVRPRQMIERVEKVFGKEKVALLSCQEVISRYSLSPDTYRKLARNFAAQIDCTLAELQNGRTHSGAIPQVDFHQLIEGAALLGAERLSAVLDATLHGGSAALDPSRVPAIEAELKIARKALTQQMT